MKKIVSITNCFCVVVLTISAAYSIVTVTNAAVEVLVRPEYSQYETK